MHTSTVDYVPSLSVSPQCGCCKYDAKRLTFWYINDGMSTLDGAARSRPHGRRDTAKVCKRPMHLRVAESHLYKYFFLSVVYFLQPHLFDLASLVLGIEGGSFCLYFLHVVFITYPFLWFIRWHERRRFLHWKICKEPKSRTIISICYPCLKKIIISQVSSHGCAQKA